MTAPRKQRPLVIVGDSAFAEVALEYFDADSNYDVVAFSVEQSYLRRNELLGRPVVSFETLSDRYPPESHDVYVAIVYTQLNRLRSRLASAARSAGYRLASYVSSRASVWRNVQLGEHCFIFENNVVQPFVKIGNNVVLWSGNHIGHHSTIGNNVFVSSHVVISGFCQVGDNCFLGVNSSCANNVTVAKDCWIGPGVALVKDTKEGEIHRAAEFEVASITAPRFFKARD
ncbi:MAG TPA: acetyltransferase [Pyrinomonadaceae bacterium]|nr:acetyltransferase [Pyrinomonadaceae bacterium]